ncbi:hypothetical protein J2T17_000732 [Paenibacillus mucilaginosus]
MNRMDIKKKHVAVRGDGLRASLACVGARASGLLSGASAPQQGADGCLRLGRKRQRSAGAAEGEPLALESALCALDRGTGPLGTSLL